MLARRSPFAGMARGTLLKILAILIVIEIALGAAAVYNNRSGSKTAGASTASSTPTVQRMQCTEHPTVQNYPRTVLVGQDETFSVCLPDYPNVWVLYTVAYSDNTGSSYKVHSDARGYSEQSIQIKHFPKGGRDSVTISVDYLDKVHISTRFAVQSADYNGKS